MGYHSIGNAISGILIGMGTTKLKAVYNYDAKTSDAFPYATVSVRESSEEFLDTSTNTSTKSFTIRVVNVNKNVEVMESFMRLLCDDILAELRKGVNETLGGIAVKFAPFAVQFGWSEGELPTRVFEIQVSVQELFEI